MRTSRLVIGRDVLPRICPESVGNSPQTLADSDGLTDGNIEAGWDSIPIVAHLRVATGWNGMASELGACDLVRLPLARRSWFLFGSGGECGHVSSNSCLNERLSTEAQKTESNRRCRQHDFQVHRLLRSLSRWKKNGVCARFPTATLRSPPLKHDLVGPARGAPPIIFAADSPGE